MSTTAFAHTRNALHHALQVPSALAATHLPADDQHRYTNLGWDPGLLALMARPVDGIRAGLRLRDAVWIVVRGDERLGERPLVGTTMMRAYQWLQGLVAMHGIADRELVAVDYDLPAHPVQDGQPFADLDEGTLGRLHDWYALTHTVLTGLCAQEPRALPVRCWPHHFDLATLIVVDPDRDPEQARSIGIGMAPGDEEIAAPYLYVTPWPRPTNPELPPLSRGRWHQGKFLAAVFDPDVPVEASISAFVGEAVAHGHHLLET